MYDTILVPADGSDHAIRAAEHARTLARLFDATVHVINVVDLDAEAGLFDAGGVPPEFVERLEEDGRNAIESVEEVVGEAATVRTTVLEGSPADTILESIDDHDVDLVAMGTEGRTGVTRYIAGSVTERVVRLSDAPVLTARASDEETRDGYDELLVPTDGSDPASAATDHALAIAAAADARVHAVNVIDGDRFVDSGISRPGRVLSGLESVGESAVEAVETRASEAGVDATSTVREGVPVPTILDYVEENDVDLVAMGTTGRTGLSRYLLGSTAEHVIRRADVPVITVHGSEATGRRGDGGS